MRHKRSKVLFMMCVAAICLGGVTDPPATPREQPSDRDRRQTLNSRMLALEEEGALRPFASLPDDSASLPARLPQPGDDDLAGAALYEHVSAATVMLHTAYKCERCENWHGGVASGFVIHPDGWIVTAAHVVNELDESNHLGAMTIDGEVYPIVAKGPIDARRDIALLRMDTRGEPARFLALATATPAAGEPVSVVSHPQSHFFLLTEGVVARVLDGSVEPPRRLQITAGFARGSSGAPVVDSRGNVVGIAISTRTIYANNGNDDEEPRNPQLVVQSCVPVDEIHALLEGHREVE